jgi:hypothetical protein
MPFLQEGGSEADFVSGPVGYGLPAGDLVVDPDQIAALRRGLDDERARVHEWIRRNRIRLRVEDWATDPCTREAAEALRENGEAAVTAARGYLGQLAKVMTALDEIAMAYRVTEDGNAGRLGRAHP